MKIVNATVKIACAFEAANQIEGILVSDPFARGVRQTIAALLDTGHADLDERDIVVEVNDEDVHVMYSDEKEEKDNNG